MTDGTLLLLVAVLTALPFAALYWVARFLARRRLAIALRSPRALRPETVRRWTESGALDPELVPTLATLLAPVDLFYEWVWADPDVARWLRFRQPVSRERPLEDLAAEAWAGLPEGEREAARQRLLAAVEVATIWWGGAESGWNRRPLAVPESTVGRRRQQLPLLPLPDLTAAPLPGPFVPEALRSADGAELALVLAVLRRTPGRFWHPLAPREGTAASLIAGLSTEVATGIGRRMGAGLGAVLGPVGAMIGQYLGEMAGKLGGQAIAQQALPEAIVAALQDTEAALARLGRLAATDDFARAARQPADAVLAFGRRVERTRAARSRALRERLWPSAGLGLLEEILRAALRELQAYRAAAQQFVEVARRAPEPVAGGMLLQNPWLARSIPGAVDALNDARAALNRAAASLGRARPPR